MATAINLPNISQQVKIDTRSVTLAMRRATNLSRRLKELRKDVDGLDESSRNLTKSNRRLANYGRNFDEISKHVRGATKALKDLDKVNESVGRTQERTRRRTRLLNQDLEDTGRSAGTAAKETEALGDAIKKTPRSKFIGFASNLPKVRKEIDAAAKNRTTKIDVRLDKRALRGLGSGAAFLPKTFVPVGIGALISTLIPLVGSLTNSILLLGQGSLIAVPALTSLGASFGVLGIGLVGITKATDKFTTNFRKQLKPLGNAFKAFRVEVRKSLLEGVAPMIVKTGKSLLRNLRPAVLRVSEAWNDVFKNSLKFFNNANRMERIRKIFAASAGTVKEIGKQFRSVLDMVLTIGSVGAPIFNTILGNFSDSLSKLNQRVQDMAKKGTLDQFIKDGIAEFKRLWEIVKLAGSVFQRFREIAGKAGADVVGSLGKILETMNTLLGFKDVQEAFGSTFRGVGSIIKGLSDNLGSFRVILVAIGKPMEVLGKAVGDVLATTLPFVADAFKALSPALTSVVGLLTPLSGIISAIGPSFVKIAQFAAPVITLLAKFAGTILVALTPVIKTVAESLATLLPQAFAVLGPILTGVGGMILRLAPLFGNLVTAVTPLISALLTVAQNMIKTLSPAIFETITVVIGGVIKALTVVVGWITKGVQWFTTLNPAVQTGVLVFAGLAGVFFKLGGYTKIMFRVFGFLFKIFQKLAPVLRIAMTVFRYIRIALLALSGPIGLIILGVTALVAAIVYLWRNNETFRAVVMRVWEAVKNTVAAVVDWFVNKALPWLRSVWEGIAAGAKWMWENVLKPTFKFIGELFAEIWENIKVIWSSIIQPVFAAIGEVVMWLWNVIMKPIFYLIRLGWAVLAAAFQLAWKYVIQPSFQRFAEIAKWLWENVLKPVWKRMQDGWKVLSAFLSDAWKDRIKPMFDRFREGVKVLGEAFSAVKDSIKRRWDGLVEVISGPLNTIKDFINQRFIGPINSMLDKLGVTVKLPLIGGGDDSGRGRSTKGGQQKYAGGGKVAGSSPSPTADNIPALLTAKEWVIRQASSINMMTKFPGYLEHINRFGRPPGFASGGQVSASPKKSSNSALPRFAAGGLVGLATNPVKYAKDKLLSLLDNFGLSGAMRGFATGNMERMGQGIGDRLKSAMQDLVGPGGSTAALGAGAGAYGWKALWETVHRLLPSIQLTSSVRPGAITALGNKSLHSMGRAIDVAPPSMSAFRTIKAAFPNATQLFYSPADGQTLLNGRPWKMDAVTKAGHYDHIHLAMARGGMVPNVKKGMAPRLADIGTTLRPGLNMLDNKLGKPEPLVRADLLDARLATLTAAIQRNTDLIVRASGGSSGAVVRTNTQTEVDHSAIAAAVAEALKGINLSGRLTFDERGNAYIEGIAQSVYDNNEQFAKTKNRMRR